MKDKLKSCPFCGCQSRIQSGVALPLTMVVCPFCTAVVSFLDEKFDINKITALYNNRAGSLDIKEETFKRR
jgi:hypothetical protein